MRSFFRKLGWLLRRGHREEDLQAELRFHLEETAEEHRMEGAAPQAAEWAARRDLGSVAAVQEDTRATWTWNWFEQFRQDFRYAVRTLIHNPVFTIMAALSLALGIGANTAIYSFLDALLLRSLPVFEPQRLAVLNWHNTWDHDTVFHGGSGNVYDDAKYGFSARIFPYPAFETFQKSQTVFSSLFAYLPTRNLNLMIRGQAEIDAGQYVSGDYFRGLGLNPAAGRLLTPEDDRAGAPPVLVSSFGFGQARFGSATAAVGQSILVNNTPFTVVGVAPPDFFGVDPAVAAEFYIPVHTNVLVDPNRFGGARRRYLGGNDYWIELMGRLRSGVSLPQAQAQLATVFHSWVETTATTNAERTHLPELHLTNGGNGIDTLRRMYSQPFYLLFAMVGFVLAIACANIANLLLARTTSRRREMAVRLGLGAGRWRIVRQLLTESMVLALLGGVLGVLFALGGVRFLTVLLASGGQGFPLRAELNWHVFGVAVALSITTGLLFGLAPALQATRVDVVPALKGDRSAERRLRLRFVPFRLNHALVVAQIGLSLLLLAGAGLFVRTLSNLRAVSLGFNRENLLVFKLNARQAGHPDPEITTFYGDLQQRFGEIPGVRNATVSNSPLVGDGTWTSPVVPLGKPAPDHAPDGHGSFGGALGTHILTVGPAFFTTMQIPLLAGREFDERDRVDSPPVAIVNEAWARVNLEDQNPLGQQIVLYPDSKKPQQMEVIGVAKNARYGDLKGEYPPVVYMAFRQNLYRPPEEATYALRSSGDPLALTSAVREIVHQADSRLPVTGVKTQAAMVDQTMTAEMLFAELCTGFALLALAIACVGLYGTIAYTVARRTSEIGIRVALGATRTQVLWLVMRQVAAMASMGLIIGVLAAFGLSRLVASLLYGVNANDPMAIGLAMGTLLIAVTAAGYLPARRAARIQPMVALRHE
ncbi:MAG: ABC transporter permease [Acidobacteriia bacterium]|nr:ABC transporter permease [Terriglobia bacterium]